MDERTQAGRHGQDETEDESANEFKIAVVKKVSLKRIFKFIIEWPPLD